MEPGTENLLKPFASGTLKVNRKFQSTISINGKPEIIAALYVVNEGNVTLIGRETAKRLGILKLGISANVNARRKRRSSED